MVIFNCIIIIIAVVVVSTTLSIKIFSKTREKFSEYTAQKI